MSRDDPIVLPHWDGSDFRVLDSSEYDQMIDELENSLSKIDAKISVWASNPDREPTHLSKIIDDVEQARCAWIISRSGGSHTLNVQYLLALFCEWNRDTCGKNVALAFRWDEHDIANMQRSLFLTRWFSFNAPAVRVDEKTAAVLSLTRVPVQEDGECKAPWDAFILRLPVALFPSGRGPGRYFTHIEVHRETDPVERWFCTSVDSGGSIVQRAVRSFWDFAKKETRGVRNPTEEDIAGVPLELEAIEDLHDRLSFRETREEVIRNLTLGRIIVNAVIFMTNGALARREPKKKKGVPAWRRIQKQPQTTEYVLLPEIPVTFDVFRAVVALREAMTRGKPGLLQWIVRGHWRRQACGPKLERREYRWIAPYWKGKASARRAVRAHAIAEQGGGEV